MLVATIRALKFNGGLKKDETSKVDMVALKKGIVNLIAHIEMLGRIFNVNVIVALNKFITDTDEEVDFVKDTCNVSGARFVCCEAWAKGGEGAEELARAVVDVAEHNESNMTYAYESEDSILDKIKKVAVKIYGADDVKLSVKAKKHLKVIEDLGYGKLPICIAKTQYSLSDNANLLGRPNGFTMNVEDIELRSGAGFVVVIAGNIMLMPGLSKSPAASKMTIDENNKITGLF